MDVDNLEEDRWGAEVHKMDVILAEARALHRKPIWAGELNAELGAPTTAAGAVGPYGLRDMDGRGASAASFLSEHTLVASTSNRPYKINCILAPEHWARNRDKGQTRDL